MQQTIDWDLIRKNYQLPNQKVYFNSSSFGALSNRTVKVQLECLASWQLNGNTILGEAHDAAKYLRKEFLNLLNAQDHQSAVLSDVSTGMNLLAEVFGRDKRIALLDKDFPAVNMPFIGRGFNIQWVKRANYYHDLSRLEDVLEQGVDVLVMSWVMYNTGQKMDIHAIGELCKKYGTVFALDATQGLGAHSLDLSQVNVDVLLCSCFKWFLAGYGTCMMVCKNSFVRDFPIQAAGQYTIISAEADLLDPDNHRQGIERLELGHIKILPVLALKESFSELVDIGFTSIQERTHQLMKQLHLSLEQSNIEVLTPIQRSNNIVMIEGTPERVKKLEQANIGCTYRNGLIRFGIYFYNNEDDILALIRALN